MTDTFVQEILLGIILIVLAVMGPKISKSFLGETRHKKN